MDYLAVKDLKRPKAVRETLHKERQVVLTKDGRPFAILVEVDPDGVEDALREVRRAMFSSAVGRARRRARTKQAAAGKVAGEVTAVRKGRS
jgi:hypothetical protein